jgi:hypothetical protein
MEARLTGEWERVAARRGMEGRERDGKKKCAAFDGKGEIPFPP